MKKAFLISLGCEDRLKIIRDVLKEKFSCRIFISDFDHTKKKYIDNKDSECEYIHVPEYNKNISFGRIRAYISFSHAEQILSLSDDDIIRMKKNAYQCYLELMTPQGLFDVVQSALRNTGIL